MPERIRCPSKVGRVSDYDLALNLYSYFPCSFRLARDLVVAVKRARKGGGFFTSQSSLNEKVRRLVYELTVSLEVEGFDDVGAAIAEQRGLTLPERNTKAWHRFRLFEFLTLFSGAFPNWKYEYWRLSELIHELFPTPAPPKEPNVRSD